jgi:uncharacterized protein YxjI
MSNSNTNVEDGWNRYYVKSSGALTRDIAVFSDETLSDQLYKVDGKMFKKNAAIVDAMGTVVLKAVLKTIPFQVEFTDIDGNLVANLNADSPLKKKYMAISLAGGDEWVLEGEQAKKAYTIIEGEEPIVRMDLKSLPLHKEFTVDVADGVDVPLAVGVAWALNLAVLQRIAAVGGATAAT